MVEVEVFEDREPARARIGSFQENARQIVGIEPQLRRLVRKIELSEPSAERGNVVFVESGRDHASERDLRAVMDRLAPALLPIRACAPLTAAKIVGEVAGVDRFRSKEAFARHNGPLLSRAGREGGMTGLSRVGNRQLNRAIHTIALTQARHHPDARAFLERRRTEHHDTPRAALRALKRRLSDVVYRALLADTEATLHERLSTAA
ncbi:MAG: IS110 family transposase [Actinobacteria bacterium]|nr:IS110 family transposase [Actinomycetota bacterium]